jgi:peroxiredoxin family protein
MSVTKTSKTDSAAPFDEDRLNRLIDERVEAILAEKQKSKRSSLAIIATKGTLDMAYPPFILASTAAAMDWDVSVFFTFYGLELLRKDLDLKISPLGNPAMPMKMPMGPDWFRNINWAIPNSVASNMPGFESAATALMKKTIENKGVASIETLREAAMEAGAELYACQMTVDLFSYSPDEFIPEVAGWIGAAAYLPKSAEADVSLFI